MHCATVTFVSLNNMKSLSYSRFSMKNFFRNALWGPNAQICIAYIILRNHISNNGNKLRVQKHAENENGEKKSVKLNALVLLLLLCHNVFSYCH